MVPSSITTSSSEPTFPSGSTDDSVQTARKLGVKVVELDTEMPFTAARARNTGIARLREMAPNLEFVQVVDGDCELRGGWCAAALAEMQEDSNLAVACGRRRERDPDGSVYNRLIDMEWSTPVGDAPSCGGDAVIRLAAFDEVEGYESSMIAGEEPEMCLRMRQKGWRIRRLDHEMTWHDAELSHLGQWWRRIRDGSRRKQCLGRLRGDIAGRNACATTSGLRQFKQQFGSQGVVHGSS